MAFTQISMYHILGSMRLVLATLGLMANSFQGTYCIIKKKYKTNFEKSLISLCFADIFTSLALIGLGCAEVSFKLGLYYFAMNILVSSSATTMFNHTILIAAQRLIAVVYPLRVKIIISKRRFYVLLALTWILSCIFGIVLALAVEKFVRVNCYMVFVSSIELIIFYAGISYTTYRKDKGSRQLTRHEDMSRSRAVLLHSILVTSAFIICFVPFAIYYLFFFKTLKPISILFELLVSINPLLDAIIYFYMKHCQRNKEPKVELVCNTKAIPTVNSNAASVADLYCIENGSIKAMQGVEFGVITCRI